jgi:hypothetical protein
MYTCLELIPFTVRALLSCYMQEAVDFGAVFNLMF